MTDDQTPAPSGDGLDPAPTPKSKPAKAEAAAPDPFELHWLGGPEPILVLPGVPADDLTAHMIDRLVYQATTGTLPSPDVEGAFLVRGLRHGDEGFDQHRGDIVASLRASGLYSDAPEGK